MKNKAARSRGAGRPGKAELCGELSLVAERVVHRNHAASGLQRIGGLAEGTRLDLVLPALMPGPAEVQFRGRGDLERNRETSDEIAAPVLHARMGVLDDVR